jgi:hypothetical protein
MATVTAGQKFLGFKAATTTYEASMELEKGGGIADDGNLHAIEDIRCHLVETPSGAGAAGVAGTIVVSTTHIYVCVATDTWKKVALAAF